MSADAQNGESLFPVVGVGASAGGLRALEVFFQAMPAEPSMAFVVLTHLAPDQPSQLAEILARMTALTVEVARDGQAVEKNKVYVLPPHAFLTISEGILDLHETEPAHHERSPIDLFFSSLAHDRGRIAFGVVLSGAGSDGVMGVRAIAEKGGVTFAQAGDADGPEFAGMPDSAIASGLVDFALPVDSIPARLVEIALRLAKAGGMAVDERPLEADMDVAEARRAICDVLHRATGHDFSGYKTGSFMRRVQRRMRLHDHDRLTEYVAFLQRDSGEATRLFRDLMINVTSFFRDKAAFEALEQKVIPALFEGRSAGDWLRIWTPGCSTGEEAVSIAILLREHMATMRSPPRVTIYATDIDDVALRTARAGRYPEQVLQGLSPERLKRFFVAYPGGYAIAQEVRELCVFSIHNILRDPPFSRMDLISCRNLLIYFDVEAQRKVFPIFHYVLRTGGFLFLGLSETIGRHTDLFAPFDHEKCLYQVRDAARVVGAPLFGGGARLAPVAIPASGRFGGGTGPLLRQLVEPRIAMLTPPHVVVNAEGEIVFASGRTGKYLELAPGVPSRQLLSMVQRDLRFDLRAALREALPTRRTVTRENVRYENPDGVSEQVTLRVEPLPERAGVSPEFLVVFQEGRAEPEGRARTSATSSEKVSGQDGATGDILRYRAELNDTREQLHATVEAYEGALEELRSANEQLSSLNEEMQCSNEELETSKEELQSLNEEMLTVNQEVMHKAEDLDRANAELRDVFVNTRIATIFLDRKLEIRSFTQPATLVFSIRLNDIGRSLSELATSLDYPALHDDLAKVLETGAAMELSVRNKESDPRYYLIKLTPWLDSDKEITGVAATFIDAPSLARSEKTIEKLFSDRVAVIRAMSAGLAHEINQPLQSVSNYLTVLRRQVTRAPDTMPEGITHTLDQTIKQVLRAGRIIRDLRAFIAEDEPDKTIFGLHELIREVGEMFTDGLPPNNTRPRLQLVAGNDRVIADRTQIDQVLVNLIKNAQEAMIDSTARELTIETARVENGMIRVDVTDTGAGFSTEVESRLFEPFLSTKTSGMGIGLPISHKIVEAHQGKIWARSNPDGGAIFSFTLPLAGGDSGRSGEWAI